MLAELENKTGYMEQAASEKPFKIPVSFFHRKPRAVGTFSIEFIFSEIRKRLDDVVESNTQFSTFQSNGIWKRIYNAVEASFRQSTVNHITGDVNYLALFLNGKKTILTIHDCYFLYWVSGMTRKLFKKLWLDIPVNKCKYIVAVSEATKSEIIKFTDCPPEKIRVIYSIVSDNYQPSPKQFNIDKPNILHIGTAPNKNFERLAEAIKGLNCKLTVIGKLDKEKTTLLEKNGVDFSFVYNISDGEVLEQYRQCDLLCFTSVYEGFGMPIIEANAVGRPVLTSNISSMPEVAGDAACLVDPYNVEAIRAGLLKIINDKDYRQQLIGNGYENRKRFDIDKIADQYYQLYKEVSEA